MKAIVAAAIGAALFIVPTLGHAEEPSATFGGAYIGLNAGAAWGSSHYETDPGCPPTSIDAVFCNASPASSSVNGTAVASSGTGKLTPSGFTGGVQGGYNWQMGGGIVVGGEADFGAFDLSQSATIKGAFPQAFLGNAYTLNENMSTDWIATIRGRLGVSVTPQILLYATGGVAFTDFEFSSSYSDNAVDATFPGGSGSGSKSGVRTGWTLGGGGEWLLNGRWSIKAEYLYVDFGSEEISVPITNTAPYRQTMEVDAELTAHIARAGLNYRF
jgi:outer membrane immunogenic protein